MPVSKSKKIIAIVGRSCTGKTALAKKLSGAITVPVRHCGEVIKSRARILEISPILLPVIEHEVIDKETLQFIRDNPTGAVIDGGFLRYVLGQAQPDGPNVFVIQLECSEQVRAERQAARASHSMSIEAIRQRDSDDDSLASKLYGGLSESLTPVDLLLDTSLLNLDKVYEVVREALRERSLDLSEQAAPISSDDS